MVGHVAAFEAAILPRRLTVNKGIAPFRNQLCCCRTGGAQPSALRQSGRFGSRLKRCNSIGAHDVHDTS